MYKKLKRKRRKNGYIKKNKIDKEKIFNRHSDRRSNENFEERQGKGKEFF
jgi:hypothetical protein